MRLTNLEIREFRGIRCLDLDFSSDGILIYGPNGVGKSSIIEAIEFLLTGEVSNVTGAGTGRKSPTNDIHHQEASPAECKVTGTFSGSTKTRIQRGLDDGELKAVPVENNNDGEENEEVIPPSIQTLKSATESKLNFLTRSDLLKFVDSPDSERGAALNEMLRLDKIDHYRKNLQSIKGDFEDEWNKSTQDRNQARKEFYSELESGAEEVFKSESRSVASNTTALEVVNELRAEYNANPLEELEKKEFTVGITEPEAISVHPLARSQTVDRLQKVDSIVGGLEEEVIRSYKDLIDTVEELESHPKLRRDVKAQDLIKLGQEIAGDEADRCPLCLEDWSDRDLTALLQERRENAIEAEHMRGHIEERVEELASSLRELEYGLNALIEDLEYEIPEKYDVLDSERETLREFSKRANELKDQLTDGGLLDVPHREMDEVTLSGTLIPPDIQDQLNHLQNIAENVEKPDDRMAAYKTLAIASDRRDNYKEAEERLEEKEELHEVAERVFSQFQSVRQQLMDDTLSEVYDEFVSLLSTFSNEIMIDPDGGKFQSTDTGVEFRIPFHDGEVHRPNLLFSEGQQDIIGLALFLSMTRSVTPECVDLVLLDDVLSSVDANHRANVARILNSEYGEEFQFLFTTHDLVWSRHLRRSEHIDSQNNVVHLSGWSYYAGVHQHIDITKPQKNIDYHLQNNDLTAAAAWARKMAEYYSAKGCENFNVEIRFDKIQNLSLRDYLIALLPEITELLRDGETDGETVLNDSEKENLLESIGEVQLFIDQNLWGMNKNVHYSEPEAASFTKDELKSNLEIFEEVFDVLYCENCESWRSETNNGIECNCSVLVKT